MPVDWQRSGVEVRGPGNLMRRAARAVPSVIATALLQCGVAVPDVFAGPTDLLIAGATSGQPAADAANPAGAGEPIAGFRDIAGYGLGMTLTDFKTLPLTDKVRFPKARVLCSGDGELQQSTAMGDMRPMPDEAQVGMIRCNVFHPDPVNVSWWAPLLPTIAGQPGKAVTYYFLPENRNTGGSAKADDSYRLLFSQYLLPAGVMDEVRHRLIGQFGNPARREAGVDALNNVAWTDFWQSRDAWVLLDSKERARKFMVTYIAVPIAESAAGHRFDANGDPLYYSMFRHLR